MKSKNPHIIKWEEFYKNRRKQSVISSIIAIIGIAILIASMFFN